MVRFCCFLLYAINHEDAVTVRKVLSQGADANTRSRAAALRFWQVIALLLGHKSIDTLVRHGADVNAQADCGYTVLMYAVMSRDERVVKQVLDYGAIPKTTLQVRIQPENLFGCIGYNAPKEAYDKIDRIRQLIIQARKARKGKQSAP